MPTTLPAFGAEEQRGFLGKPGRCSDGPDLLSPVALSTCPLLGTQRELRTSEHIKGLSSTLHNSSLALKTASRAVGSKSPGLLTSRLSLPSASLSMMSKISSWIFSPCKKDQTRVCSFPTENGAELLEPGVKPSQIHNVTLRPGCHQVSELSPC